MPVQTHVVRMIFLVLCLSMLTLQTGCSNSGSGSAEAPANNANAVHLALSTTNGSTAVVADGRSAVPIRLQATNGSGAAMAGVPVTFATTAGALSGSPVVRSASSALSRGNPTTAARADSSGSVTVTTDTNGVAQVLLTASTTAGTAAVTADAMGFRTHIDISFVPGPAASVQLNASPNTVNASGTSTLTATVKDANGNPVPGTTVTFTLSTNTSGASLNPTSGTTDGNGQATAQYTAGTTGGADTVRVQVTSSSVVGVTSITVTAPPGSSSGASRIDLLVNSPQLGSNGADNVTLTALVRNADNNVLSGLLVNFTADSGSIQVTNGTTGAAGTATALLTTGGDPRNRKITVTARVGNLSSTNSVQVTGTTLTVSGASSLVLGVTTRLSILLRDSGGTGIQNQTITVSSALGNTLSAPTVTTDVTGQASVDVTARVPGTDTIQVTALGAMTTASLLISAANFILTAPAPAAQVPLNTPQAVTVHWDETGVNQAGQTINFFATRGNFAATPTCPAGTTPTISTTTDANGNATVNVCSNNAGPAVISAAANVSPGPSSQVSIEFIATTAASLVLQASLTTLSVNAPGSSTHQSVITAVIRDAQGNLVKNQTVSFSLTDVSGGQIFPASAVTDSFGRASTVYTAGAVPSAKDGVVITAAVGAVTDRVTLTVTRQALFVILGTGNLINTPTSTQYALPYSVLVTDVTGNPVANAIVELSVLPSRSYQKGFYSLFFDSNGNCTGWGKVRTSPDCQNEDSNFNGLLDPGEDFNNNSRLDPGNVATVPPTVTTDASGFALFDVVYAREFTWVEVELEARTIVTGSEGSAQVIFFLRGAASDFNNCSIAPPGQVSPYGIATTCVCDERTDATCPVFTGTNPVTLTAASTTLPNVGGTFTFGVSGGTQTSYNLTATAGTLSTQSVIFGQTFSLTLPPNPSTTTNLTINLTARDATTGQVGTLSLTQLP